MSVALCESTATYVSTYDYVALVLSATYFLQIWSVVIGGNLGTNDWSIERVRNRSNNGSFPNSRTLDETVMDGVIVSITKVAWA